MPQSRATLWAEFGALYLVAPLVLAVALPPDWMFPALFAVTALGVVLLHRTEGFAWAELTAGIGRIRWGFVAGFTALTFAVGLGAMLALRPEALFFLIRVDPALMLAIALLYPILSALPQELVFRPLFFRRYGPLLPKGPRTQILWNAALFAFAHLMYWSVLVAVLTFAGGLAFAAAYRVRGNFPEAVLLHALAGIVVFALGLGVYFYSGNVQRPF